jgi:hypothetical protein
MGIAVDPKTGRLPVQVVERLHRFLGGDSCVEGMILEYIQARWSAGNLFHLPPRIADEVIERPHDFIRAAKRHEQPELGF